MWGRWPPSLDEETGGECSEQGEAGWWGTGDGLVGNRGGAGELVRCIRAIGGTNGCSGCRSSWRRFQGLSPTGSPSEPLFTDLVSSIP